MDAKNVYEGYVRCKLDIKCASVSSLSFSFLLFFMIALAFKAVSQRQRRVVADIAKAA